MTQFGYQDSFPHGISDVTTTIPAGLSIGDRRRNSGEEYAYVFNSGGEQVPPSFGVIIASGAASYSCTITSVTGATPFFGVVKHTTLTTDAFGWVLRQGIVAVEAPANTGIAIGENLMAGDAGVSTPKDTAAGTGLVIPAINAHGFGLAATASGGSASAYINCF